MVHSFQKLGLDGCVDVVLGGSREAVRRCAASSASHGERPSRLGAVGSGSKAAQLGIMGHLRSW